MSLVFFGTPWFAVVVTRRDKRRGRSSTLLPSPVKELALSKGLRVIQPASMKDEGFIRELASLRPEFLVVVAYGRVLPQRVLDVPSIAPVNLHASLLPGYRGASPIAWAILNGEAETGLCTMLMTAGLDEGDILLEEAHPILEEDTAESLGIRLSEAGGPLLAMTLKGMREGTITPRPQTGEATYAPPLNKGDGRVDWSRTAVELFNFVRGMYPWPGAFCFLDGLRIKLVKVSPENGEGKQGAVESVSRSVSSDSFAVGTGGGFLRVFELQPEGKKTMSARAFLQGRKIKKGILIT
jgi:methionyl-tRNA formyltransferase